MDQEEKMRKSKVKSKKSMKGSDKIYTLFVFLLNRIKRKRCDRFKNLILKYCSCNKIHMICDKPKEKNKDTNK